MNPNEIYKTLVAIDKFPKSSMMVVALIEAPGKTSMLDNTVQRTLAISMKSSWKLEDKPPTKTFPPTDESVIAYVRTIADEASQSRVNLLVVIDLNKNMTNVWVARRSMCFVATATYDSPLAREVVILSEFRDEVLTSSKLGRLLVRLYCCTSPSLASFIDRKKLLKSGARKVLDPIVQLVSRRMKGRHFHV